MNPCACVFICVWHLGGYFADWWFGNYRTQLYANIIWAFGALLMLLSIFTPLVDILSGSGAHNAPANLAFALGGLFLVALGAE